MPVRQSSSSRSKLVPRTLSLACWALLAVSTSGWAQETAWGSPYIIVGTPNWEIQLTDSGYSDYLGDLTPGFQGREYLSGEWAAAVGYKKGSQTVTPTWLEPKFVFPDWETNSNFTTQSPMTQIGVNSQNLPITSSVISNGDLRITQRAELIDTVTGMALGYSAASAAGSGQFVGSNRYVLQQTYSIENTSNEAISNLQLFQLLHGLTSQQGVYDNRDYGGALGEYRYDVTLAGDSGNAAGQFDYISFSSKVAPTAVELGHYGTESTDSHSVGKPSVGTHLSVEDNALNGNDSFTPTERWVAGAERWDLGVLQPGQVASMDVVLSIRTGWQVPAEGTSGSTNGGSSQVGGVDYMFEDTHSSGKFFVSYSAEDLKGIQEQVAAGEFGAPTFDVPGGTLQVFEIEFEGSFSGLVTLTVGYDTSLLPPELDPARLHVYHWKNGSWIDLGGVVDVVNHTITFATDSFSPFAIGVAPGVPEPGALAMLAAGMGALVWRRKRQS
jgi:hypothetical protein